MPGIFHPNLYKGGPGRDWTCDQTYLGAIPVRLHFYLHLNSITQPSGSIQALARKFLL